VASVPPFAASVTIEKVRVRPGVRATNSNDTSRI
jgi:hypothetical protein